MKVVAFVDHEIGHRLLRRMLRPPLSTTLQIVAIVTTQANGARWWPGVSDIAREHQIPLFRHPAQPAELKQMGPIDRFLLLSWPYVLKPEMLAVSTLGAINLHYSLLPKYRGVYPVNWAVIFGDKETGVTYHQVGENVDHGPIICQERIPILQQDTARSLYLRLDDLAENLFDVMLTKINSSVPSTPISSGPYFNRRDFELTNAINLEKNYTGRELINLLRGKSFAPHGRNAYFIDSSNGRKVYVTLHLEAEGDQAQNVTRHE